ncbi:PREDICTED: transcriptional protein SWT1-like [Drosophila arizonae]|uniref:Transcriptional protein SWT1-like n=1 Tax=Drosophila arizonae TaxID=7263 RepID=A0ABM1PCC6_DROAR|nr:PREDICTED: transcriptional protein SWT1-like [Drosophila arizonae]
MSSKHFKKTSVAYEEQLNQLILQLKAQQLSSKPKKPTIDEHYKRLHTDYNTVTGRKLDGKRDGNKSILKFSPCRPSRQCVEDQEKHSEKENSKAVNEKLKNFKFDFPVASEIKKCEIISVKLDFTKGRSREKVEVEAFKKEESKKQNKHPVPQYQLDHMYFVLDTNVLMDSLRLLDDVSKLTLRDTAGSILYIPYMVIKELDSLKYKQMTSYAARRAINYLNDKFDDLEPIEAQSALEDADQLIDVDSGDDSILNCCLQLKEQLDHMILLTNDNNLRLKALASSIRVSTCYQLISHRSNWWSQPRERRTHRRHKYRVGF